MKKFFIFYLLFSSLFAAARCSSELERFYRLVRTDEILNTYLDNFPAYQYQIFQVSDLGSFYLDVIDDNIKSQLRKGIYWEGNIGKLLIQYTRPGTIAVDFGSHIGIHTMTLSRCVGPNGIVVSFEPQLKMYREQYYNLKLNLCHHNVVQLPFCAGDVVDNVEIVGWIGPGINEGGASVGSGGVPTLMIPLDILNLTQVSCMKIDVESCELKVLQGSYDTIHRCKPVIIFEILGNHDLDKCEGEVLQIYHDTINFLVSIGYEVTRIADTNDFIAKPI